MRCVLAPLALLLVAASAAGDPFPVHYLVDYKFLKKNLDAAQTLDFQFYDDAACASSIGSVQLEAADPSIVFEKITRVKEAIEYIEGLIDQSGGFGTFLMLGHDWASPERTKNCYRLFAEKVIPHFKGQLNAPTTSHNWATAKRGELFGRAGQAMMNAIQSHVQEKEDEKKA